MCYGFQASSRSAGTGHTYALQVLGYPKPQDPKPWLLLPHPPSWHAQPPTQLACPATHPAGMPSHPPSWHAQPPTQLTCPAAHPAGMPSHPPSWHAQPHTSRVGRQLRHQEGGDHRAHCVHEELTGGDDYGKVGLNHGGGGPAHA